MNKKNLLYLILFLFIANEFISSAPRRKVRKKSVVSKIYKPNYNSFELDLAYHVSVLPNSFLVDRPLVNSFQFVLQGVIDVNYKHRDAVVLLIGVSYTPYLFFESSNSTNLQFHQFETVFSIYPVKTFYTTKRKYRDINKVSGLFPFLRVGNGFSIDVLEVDPVIAKNREAFSSKISTHYLFSLSLGMAYNFAKLRVPWLNLKTYYRMGLHVFADQNQIIEHSWNFSLGFSY